MPYIREEDRKKFDKEINILFEKLTKFKTPEGFSPGELNYIISSLTWKIFDKFKSYKMANNLIGALECVKLEIYRRQIGHYEDGKLLENGDINE